jgi:glutamyl-tRNA reductase
LLKRAYSRKKFAALRAKGCVCHVVLNRNFQQLHHLAEFASAAALNESDIEQEWPQRDLLIWA